MKLLVCGGRDFVDVNCVYTALDRIFSEANFPIQIFSRGKHEIISGAARGADTIAAQYARYRGIALQEFGAEWNTYGKRAGYVRNKRMLMEIPDAVIAFPGGKGTKMMIDLARQASVTVIQVGRDPLGNIVMGTLGPSSQQGATEHGIKTKLFQQKYIDRVSQFKMLTPGQRDGIYQEVAHEEEMWFKSRDEAAMEYEEILKMQDMVNPKDAS